MITALTQGEKKMDERTMVYLDDVVEVIYQALRTPVPDYHKDPFHDSMGVAMAMANEIPSAQPRIMICSKCKHKTKCFSQIAATNKYQTTTIFYDIDFCSRWENEDNG